jgi:hypothetical protein
MMQTASGSVKAKMYSLDVVHVLHGSVGLSIAGESDKAKAPAAASVTVLDDNLWWCEQGAK